MSDAVPATDADADLKQRAIDACQEEHRALIACYEARGFCWTEQKAFWRCYKEKRGFYRTKVHDWFGIDSSDQQGDGDQ